MGSRVKNVDDVNGLDYYESKLLHEVLMLFKVGYWESWREDHVYEDEIESSETENCIIKESFFVVLTNTLIEGIPALSKLRFMQSALIFEHEAYYEERPDSKANYYKNLECRLSSCLYCLEVPLRH